MIDIFRGGLLLTFWTLNLVPGHCGLKTKLPARLQSTWDKGKCQLAAPDGGAEFAAGNSQGAKVMRFAAQGFEVVQGLHQRS